MFPGRRPAPYVVWQDEPGEWCIWGMLRKSSGPLRMGVHSTVLLICAA